MGTEKQKVLHFTQGVAVMVMSVQLWQWFRLHLVLIDRSNTTVNTVHVDTSYMIRPYRSSTVFPLGNVHTFPSLSFKI